MEMNETGQSIGEARANQQSVGAIDEKPQPLEGCLELTKNMWIYNSIPEKNTWDELINCQLCVDLMQVENILAV